MPTDSFDLPQSGLICYVLIWDPNQGAGAQMIWNTAGAFEPYDNLNYASYVTPATEVLNSGHYEYLVQTNLPAGNYYVTAKTGPLGGEDQSDRIVASGPLRWNGTVIIDNVRLMEGQTHGGAGAKLFLSSPDGTTPFQLTNAIGGYVMRLDSTNGICLGMVTGANSANGHAIHVATNKGKGINILTTDADGIGIAAGGSGNQVINFISGSTTSLALAFWDFVVESLMTGQQLLRLVAAALFGKRSNMDTPTEQYDAAGSPGVPRIVGNLNASGAGTPTLTP